MGKGDSDDSSDLKKNQGTKSSAGSMDPVAAVVKKKRRRRPRRKKKPSVPADAKSLPKDENLPKPKKVSATKKQNSDEVEKKDEDVVRGAYDYVQEPQEGVYSMDESGQYLSGEAESDITLGKPDEQIPPIDVGKMTDDSVGEESLIPEDSDTSKDLSLDGTVNEEALEPEEIPPDLESEEFSEREDDKSVDIEPEEAPPELGEDETEFKSESDGDETSADILSVKPADLGYVPGHGMDEMPEAFKEPSMVEESLNVPDFVEESAEQPEIQEPQVLPNNRDLDKKMQDFGESVGYSYEKESGSEVVSEPVTETDSEPEQEYETETESELAGGEVEKSASEYKDMGSREVIDQAETVEEPKFNDESELDEHKTLLDSLAYVGMQIRPVLARVFNLKIIFGVIVFGGLVWGGLWAYNSNVFGNLMGGSEQKTEPKEDADNVVIVYDVTLREYGIAGAVLFGGNNGSTGYILEDQILLSHYFGNLLEPKVSGETGISAALYYGELMDEASIVNQYVEFVKSLDELNNLFEIDVYELLNRNDERSETLEEYLNHLEEAKGKNEKVLQLINLYLDSLKESYNSLSPDKDKFEQDFFVALEALEAEKSDALLKSFIDVTQKQSALKARVAALEELVSYYDTALNKLARRIEAVKKNRDALLEGIRVVEVPGSGVDVIIKPENP